VGAAYSLGGAVSETLGEKLTKCPACETGVIPYAVEGFTGRTTQAFCLQPAKQAASRIIQKNSYPEMNKSQIRYTCFSHPEVRTGGGSAGK